MPRRWQLKLENGVPVEVETAAGGGWIVTAAGAVRTTNHDLERALQELVGHLVDTAWIERTEPADRDAHALACSAYGRRPRRGR